MAEIKTADLRVLLVEDDHDIAQMYRLKLESNGYLVRIATDGEAGLATAKEFEPDLIFVDIRLPGMDGLALLDALGAAQATREIPTVILTNYDDPEIQQRGLELGAREFLLKSKTTPGDLADWVARSNSGEARTSRT
jgi:two-component system, chemotaxis family, sensor kinase CheA